MFDYIKGMELLCTSGSLQLKPLNTTLKQDFLISSTLSLHQIALIQNE